ncbi:tripartite tricarboxylate transporter TctB family protein [Phreatobacter sp.]|uniref:tripartite tricarboxylate transporter TctB family protein n=1 Tax=Phreatobacter sp. TaxID=1966341 RepID=UPI003F71FAA4
MDDSGHGAPDRPVVVIGCGLILTAAIVVWQSWELRASFGSQTLGPQMMPFLVGLLLVLLGAMTVAAGLRGAFPARDTADWGNVAWIGGGLAAMILLIKTAGFVPAGAILFAATARGFGSTRPLLDLAIGAVAALFVFLFFVKLLGLTLPSGFTESWM